MREQMTPEIKCGDKVISLVYSAQAEVTVIRGNEAVIRLDYGDPKSLGTFQLALPSTLMKSGETNVQ
jgi:hypothetical protein